MISKGIAHAVVFSGVGTNVDVVAGCNLEDFAELQATVVDNPAVFLLVGVKSRQDLLGLRSRRELRQHPQNLSVR